MLTFNRLEDVDRSLRANLATAGYPIKEIIHVDNGSEKPLADWFKTLFNPSIQVLHSTNLGVAKGYNHGMLLATSSHIVITGCDRIMPDGWLKHMVEGFEAIPNTGVISWYASPTEATRKGLIEKRFTGPNEFINGMLIRRAFPCEARMHSRDFLLKAGFFREDLGLYGYEDVEWIERAERVARENNLINYIFTDRPFATHINDGENEAYREFKRLENDQPYKKDITHKLWELGSPYYNPYSRLEEDIKV